MQLFRPFELDRTTAGFIDILATDPGDLVDRRFGFTNTNSFVSTTDPMWARLRCSTS